LAVSLLFEGASWFRAVTQLRREARASQTATIDAVRFGDDPTVKTVVFEDTAAVIGILIAAVGIGLHAWTGNALWDGLASIAIGLLLVAVAYSLGRENKALLLGRSLGPDELTQLADIIENVDGIDETIEVLTMRLGPAEVLLAARVDVGDGLTGDAMEQTADRVELAIREAFPEVRHVFVDPTPDAAADGLDRRM
jgi:divalent metal cation (Fe/Co/Zn/Cd) transporter